MILRPPRSTLFPSTTLFRSAPHPSTHSSRRKPPPRAARKTPPTPRASASARPCRPAPPPESPASSCHPSRSEERTSELQSRQYLVCRLLLEKKKTLTLTIYP